MWIPAHVCVDLCRHDAAHLSDHEMASNCGHRENRGGRKPLDVQWVVAPVHAAVRDQALRLSAPVFDFCSDGQVTSIDVARHHEEVLQSDRAGRAVLQTCALASMAYVQLQDDDEDLGVVAEDLVVAQGDRLASLAADRATRVCKRCLVAQQT